MPSGKDVSIFYVSCELQSSLHVRAQGPLQGEGNLEVRAYGNWVRQAEVECGGAEGNGSSLRGVLWPQEPAHSRFTVLLVYCF